MQGAVVDVVVRYPSGKVLEFSGVRVCLLGDPVSQVTLLKGEEGYVLDPRGVVTEAGTGHVLYAGGGERRQ
jgi:hypothetical protein